MNVESHSPTIRNRPEICRLCLATTATYFTLIEDTTAAAMLEALTSLKILHDDEISTVMCLKCRLNLKLAFTIRQNMLSAEQRFREHRILIPIKQEDELEEETLIIEVYQKEDQSEYVCDTCGKTVSSKISLRRHKRSVHVQVDCTLCGKTLKQGSIKRHMDDMHAATVQTAICDICGVEKTKGTLAKHKHFAHKITKCTICDKEFNPQGLKRHLIITHRPTIDKAEPVVTIQTHVCDICGKTMPSKLSLKGHKYGVHHQQGECPICKKKISFVNLKKHIERHSNAHAVCDLCGISVVEQDLRSHMYNVHTVRELKCNFCDKIFKNNNARTMHEKREHLDEANFTCETCGKKFYRKVRLKRHIDSTHLKKRPHVCEFCKVGFSSRFALKTHVRQHTNEKPFRCEFCGDGFRQKVSLKSHLKSQHDVEEELTCECKVCGKKFASAVALDSHKRIH